MKNYFKGVLVLLFALLFMPTYADALENINRIDFSYSTKQPLIDGMDAPNDAFFIFNVDSSKPYYIEDYDGDYSVAAFWYCPYIDGRQCPVEETTNTSTLFFGRYMYASVIVYAKDGYAFDDENLDNIEVYVNGDKITNAKVDDHYYEENAVFVVFPITVEPDPAYIPAKQVISAKRESNNKIYLSLPFGGLVESYIVYVSTDKTNWTQINGVTSSKYEVPNLKPGTNYSFKAKPCSSKYCANVSDIVSARLLKENTMVTKVTNKTLKYKTLKKKKLVTMPFNVTNVKGTVTYTKVSGKKNFTVNKKNGKITVKKGTKKGTYTVKVKVKATGNNNYASKTKTLTAKIKVK